MILRGTLALLGLLLVRMLAVAQGLEAGAAKTDITPPLGGPMWGYAARHDAPSVGVLDRLHARAVVLASGKERIALVSLDLGRAPTRTITAAIRKRVKETAGVGAIFLVASHTHHGPVLELEQWPDPKKPYVRQLADKIVAIIGEAAKHLRPVQLGIASRQAAWNRNRHSRRPDAPVDHELIVVRIEDKSGKPIAHLVNFAAHPTMLDAKLRKFSADYPGALCSLVEKETGAPCLFLQGAAGDLSANPGKERGPQAFGLALGRDVLKLAGSIRCTLTEAQLQVREHDFTFRKRIALSNPLVYTGLSMAFFKGIVDFYEREYREGVRPHLTTALVGKQIGLVGVSGEFFCGHALSLKRRARLEHLLFLGYCNDYQQYFPTIEAASEGGYGTEPPVSPAEYGAGERIMDRALVDLYQMRGQLK
jgi:neutral ceramidase